MREFLKRFFAIVLSLAMVFSTPITKQAKAAVGEDSLVTSFSYEFAYATPGYADGTIYINAKEDGVYKVFWGNENGEKLTKGGREYTYLARVVVKDGAGSFNLENDYIAIPQGAETVLVYKKDSLEYVYNIPESKKFVASANSYTFGSISDPHFTRYTSVAEDDAVPAMDTALQFLEDAGIKFVAMSGDISQAGEQLAFDRFNEALAKHPNMKVITATGNHDSRTTVSTSDKSKLDTSITRWYNSITSTYYTVEDGVVKSNLGEYPLLATDALINPIDTEYRPAADEDPLATQVPGLDFVTEAGGNIFIFFNNIAKTGEVYDTDKLITAGQMDWLEEQLETYKDRNVFLYQHYYLAVNTLTGDSVDYNNCTGDLKNAGNYSYDLDFKDVVTTTSGNNLQALLSKYKNTTLVTGHSHWQYTMQGINNGINFGRLNGGQGGTMVHLSSVTEPRYIAQDDEIRTSLNGYASEGQTVTTYDDCIVFNNVDFFNGVYEAYATYISPIGAENEPVKNPGYTESTTEITGDEYLDAEDITTLQLLKSNFNLTLGAGYTYSSKGTENTDTALTDGKSTGSFWNTKWGKNSEQHATITLDAQQQVSNIKNLMIYFVGATTDAKTFKVEISKDGETYQTIGDYSGMTYKTTALDVDLSNVTIDTFKYVRLSLTDGIKDYGYQIREFAVIGYEKNANPNTAGSASSLEVTEGVIDEEELLPSDYNLIYACDYTQSSTGSEDKVGALTNGTLSGGFLNTERKSSAKLQEIVIDMGKSRIQPVSNIDFFLLYCQNTMTNVTDFNISVSLDGENYEEVGRYASVDFDVNHFDPTVDLSTLSIKEFRFVKLQCTGGKTNYGYQIKEFALIGVNPIEYPEIEDQSLIIADPSKNIALNKTVYVSSTSENEGKDKTVLTDGKFNDNKYWSSLWDSSLTSDYVVVDLGENVDATSIGSALIRFKAENTACEDIRIMFSETFDEENPDDGFVEVAKQKGSYEAMMKIADPNGVIKISILEAPEGSVRYVKFLMNGHKNWGFQVNEVALTKKDRSLKDEGVTASLSQTSVEYTGLEITPEVEVKYGEFKLAKDRDYKVTYSDNVNVGTATVVITGIGDYSGSITKTFTITAKNVNKNEFSVALSFDENNNPVLTVKYGASSLVEGVDYTIKKIEQADGSLKVIVTGTGTKFSGNFEEVIPAEQFPVVDAVNFAVTSNQPNTFVVSFDKPTSVGADNQRYDVYVDDVKVKEQVEAGSYTFDNVNAGSHSVKLISFLGNKSTQGLTKTLNVRGMDISSDKGSIKVSEEAIVYTGSSVTPANITVEYDNKVLAINENYVITYSDNVNAGTASYEIKGVGLYEGTVSGNFEILPVDLKGKGEISGFRRVIEYTGQPIVPNVEVTYDGNFLQSGVDFEVECTDNTATGVANVFVKGKGNYTGTISTTFEISAKVIDDIKVEFTFDSNKKLVVKASNGNVDMVEGIDYSYEAEELEDGRIKVTITALGDNFAGTTVKFIDAKDNPNRPTEPATEKPTVTPTTPSATNAKALARTKVTKATKKKSAKKASVSFKKVTGAKKYMIQIAASKKFKKVLVQKTIKKYKKTIFINSKKLVKPKKLYVRVKAVGAKKWSVAKKIRIKK